MVAIFLFFIMANTDIPFPSTLRKLETQTLQGFSNLKFSHMIDIYEIMPDADIPFLSTLRKPVMQIFL